jgi:hypothetical protein
MEHRAWNKICSIYSLLTYERPNSMTPSYSSEVASLSASQELSKILWNSKVH